ncbi:hypothetical protein ACFXAF_26390 [Kitasatospora sp. NPDC059463]|uniref:hypothetical protein n=1 Tax=unclassified Kitasatospora TaxID=2633591 RepID=UPI0036ACACAD
MKLLRTWELVAAPPDGVPAALTEPCARVGRDLPAFAGTLPPGTRWTLAAERPVVRLGLCAPGLEFGRSVDTALPPGELTARVAELVQDHLTGFAFLQRPACPGHSHPLLPAAGELPPGGHWRCRSTGADVAAIGGLGLSAGGDGGE